MEINLRAHTVRLASRLGAPKILVALLSSFFLVAALLVVSEPVASASVSATWSVPYLIVPVSAESSVIAGVSCPTASFCVAIDENGNAYTYGTYGSAPFLMDAHVDSNVNGNGNVMTGLSCASSTFCVAIDDVGYAVVYNGTSWGSPTLIDGSGGGTNPTSLLSVSCPTSSFCAVGDQYGSAILYQAGNWGPPQVIDSATVSINGVSCASSTFCAAVGNSGYVMMWNGIGWGVPQSASGGTGTSIEAVSCPTSSFCMATDYLGNALTYNGTSWGFSPPGQIDSNGDRVTSISCASSSFCVAGVDAASSSPFLGDVITYQDGAWGAPVNIDPSQPGFPGNISSVSCAPQVSSASGSPTSTFCVAGGNNGNFFIYPAPVPEVKVLSERGVVKSNAISINISCAWAPCKGSLYLMGRMKLGRRFVAVVLASGEYSLPLVGVKNYGSVVLGLTRIATKYRVGVNKHLVRAYLTATVQGGKRYSSVFMVS